MYRGNVDGWKAYYIHFVTLDANRWQTANEDWEICGERGLLMAVSKTHHRFDVVGSKMCDARLAAGLAESRCTHDQ